MSQTMRRKTLRDSTLQRMLGVVSVVLGDAPRDSHARRASHLTDAAHRSCRGLWATAFHFKFGACSGHDFNRLQPNFLRNGTGNFSMPIREFIDNKSAKTGN